MPQEHKPITEVRETLKVAWYRCPIAAAELRGLTQRSDAKGAFQAIGFLVLVVALAVVTWHFYALRLWGWFAVALFAYGTVFSFTPGPHELLHGTVFKTKWLNNFFHRIYCMIQWHNPHEYKRSHTYHHVYTLHPEGDREVVLPVTPSLHPLRILELLTFDVTAFWLTASRTVVLAFTGRFHNEWSRTVFADDANARRLAIRWARLQLLFHVLLIAAAIVFKLWLLPVLVTFGLYVANLWMYIVLMPMHTGLRSNVPDFRKCVRSITLDPISEFLYWHMNWHTEHHMYAAIPCYNLKRMSRAIADDMPRPRSLLGAWIEMRQTFHRQKKDPTYEFDTPVPLPRAKAPDPRDPLRASIGDLAPKGLSASA
jgi:fatty acid desaturase